MVTCPLSRAIPLVGTLHFAEPREQQFARLVVTDYADGEDFHSQRGQVHDGVAAAAGNYGALAVLQDEHRRFARDTRNLAEYEFVGHEVGQYGDGTFGKRPHDLLPALRIFAGVLS